MEENALIIADGMVVTCDPGNRAGSLTIVVRAGKIVDIGDDAAVLTGRYPGAAVMNASGMLVIPGFVNAHVHSESHALRGVTAGVPLSGWRSIARLRDALSRLESPATAADVLTIVRGAMAAHVKSGTTALAEMTAELDADVYRRAIATMRGSGLRVLSVVRSWEQMHAARELASDGHLFAMDLGAEEDFTVYSLESRVHAARESGFPLLAHVGELREHVEIVRRNFQKPLFQVLKDFGALHPDTQCVHLNHCTDADAQAAQDAGCTLTICLSSAMAKQTGYPFLRSLMAHDLRLALGTDWGSFDVLAEARLLAQLPSFVPGIPEFSSVELLRMATINGADTLGIGTETGSIEPGKRADLVLLRLDDIRVSPVSSQASAETLAALLMRSPHPPAVSDVLVGGAFEVHNGTLVHQDEPALVAELARLLERWGIEAVTASAASEDSRTQEVPRSRVFQLVPREADSSHEAATPLSPAAPAPPPERTANLNTPKRRIVQKRPAMPPELPKDVRRVFGEDDET